MESQIKISVEDSPEEGFRDGYRRKLFAKPIKSLFKFELDDKYFLLGFF